MKKIIYMMAALLAVTLVGCKPTPVPTFHSEMTVFVNGIGAITKDTTIVVHDAEMNILTGEMTMGLSGDIRYTLAPLDVNVTRSATDRIDEFCAAGKCTITNGEETQHLHFQYDMYEGELWAPNVDWYAHYNLPKEGDTDYVISYQFINHDRNVTLTIHYDYQENE
jgi:hypothetical protein